MATPSDLPLAELLRTALDSRLLDLHTAMPGTIVLYDSSTQTATVQPGIRRSLDDTLETLPSITNVPIAWPAGGGMGLKFPLSVGDSVMLVFSEASFSTWRTSGQVSDPSDESRHSLSYPLAFPFARAGLDPLQGHVVASATNPFVVGSTATADFAVLEAKLLLWLNGHAHTSTAPTNPTSTPITPATPGAFSAKTFKAE